MIKRVAYYMSCLECIMIALHLQPRPDLTSIKGQFEGSVLGGREGGRKKV